MPPSQLEHLTLKQHRGILSFRLRCIRGRAGEKRGVFLPQAQGRHTQLWIQTLRILEVHGGWILSGSTPASIDAGGKKGKEVLAAVCGAPPRHRGLATPGSPPRSVFQGPRRLLTYGHTIQGRLCGSWGKGGWNKSSDFLMEKQRSLGELLTRPRVCCTQLPWQGMRDCCSPLKTIALEMGWVGRKMSAGALSSLCSLAG